MKVELSFLVDGDMYKAVMQREKSCTELEKSELVTIKLFEQDQSILIQSFTKENGKAEIRWVRFELCYLVIDKPKSPNYKSQQSPT